MYVFLLVSGAVISAAGVALVKWGVSLGPDAMFDANIVIPGTVAIVGGLVVVGIGLALRALERIERALTAQATMGHAFAAEATAGNSIAEQPSGPKRIPFPPKPKIGPRHAVYEEGIAAVAAIEQPSEPVHIPFPPKPKIEPRPQPAPLAVSPALELSPAPQSEPPSAAPLPALLSAPSPEYAPAPLPVPPPEPEPVPLSASLPTEDVGLEQFHFQEKFAASDQLESTPVTKEMDLSPLSRAPARSDADDREINNGVIARRVNGPASPRIVLRSVKSHPVDAPERPKISLADAIRVKGPRRRRDVQTVPRPPAPSPVVELAQDDEPEPRPAPLHYDGRASVSILKSGVVDGMAYTLYSDGSIDAQLPEGTLRFGSIAELRNHIEQRS